MKLAILNCHTKGYPLANLTTHGNRKEYCKRHGYTLIVNHGPWELPCKVHPFSWGRLKLLRDTLAASDFDWIYCVGTDTFHTNFHIRLEDIIAFANKGESVVASPDWCAPIQADSFLVKKSTDGIRWLDDVLSRYSDLKDHTWSDNQAMIEELPMHQHMVKILPQWVMNSYDYPLYNNARFYAGEDKVRRGVDFFGHNGQWAPGHFLIHWPGLGLEERTKLIHAITPLVLK